MIEFSELKNIVYQDMEENLPKYLTYHSIDHTKLVVRRSVYIAEKEGVDQKDIALLKTAALFHDFGFTETYKDHEEKGCEIVKKRLPDYGYTSKEIDKICGMIMATKIPQTPHNLLEEIIADADLEYLGTDKFEFISNKLYQELLHFNPKLSVDEWNNIQIKFISSHSYHTDYCRKYREWRKQKNLKTLH